MPPRPRRRKAATRRPTAPKPCRRCGCIPRADPDGILPDRCRRCQLPLKASAKKRRSKRPPRIACRRCGAWQPVRPRGPVPKLCARCNRRGDPARPTEARCPGCATAFRICDRGPVPTHCEDCRPADWARRYRTAA